LIVDILFILYILLLAVATWWLWPRDLAPIGPCKWCGELIYEPYCEHYEYCNSYNEYVSLCIVRARAMYRERARREGIDVRY
jgi:hypothetical protein